MLTLTKKTEYALIALSHLARREERVICAREIAEASGISQSILTNVLKTLATADIVISERGSCGGYGLVRSLASISLHELITVVEGPFRFVQCAIVDGVLDKTPCELESTCPIRPPAQKIHDRLKQFLEQVSLAEILGEPETCPSAMAETSVPITLQRETLSELS